MLTRRSCFSIFLSPLIILTKPKEDWSVCAYPNTRYGWLSYGPMENGTRTIHLHRDPVWMPEAEARCLQSYAQGYYPGIADPESRVSFKRVRRFSC